LGQPREGYLFNIRNDHSLFKNFTQRPKVLALSILK
jgi:hypothetical protein